MHHNDRTFGEIVDDFGYIPKSFCSMKIDWGAKLAKFGPLVQNIG